MHPRIGPLVFAFVVGCASAACAGTDPAPSVSPRTAATSQSAATVSTSASPSAPSTTPSLGDAPPQGSLAAEGGDAVPGQVGTYTWRDGGSDSPWLPGARITVGTGEPLSVSLTPPVAVAAWQARSVPAGTAGPTGATSLGEGDGPPTFAAPGAGVWTVEVHVVFDGDLGSASYFWRLEVDG